MTDLLRSFRVKSFFIFLFFLISISGRLFAFEIDMNSVDADTLNAGQIHELMSHLKAEALGRQRITESRSASALYEQTEFDVTFYDVQLNIDHVNEQIYGVVYIEAKSATIDLSHIEIDLTSVLSVDAIYSGSQNLNYSRIGDRVIIELDQTYQIDEPFSLTIEYNGHPEAAGLDGFNFSTYNGAPIISSLSEPYMSRTWWPCKDRNDDKADSMDISVTCASNLYCASNGNLIEIVDNGDGTKTFNYEVRYPIVTYLFSIAISQYDVWTDWYYYGEGQSMPIINHVYPDWSAYSQSSNSWGATPYILTVFSDLFGQYPFINEKYGHANFQWGGGMEHQTCTSMGGSSFGFSEPVTVHEAAHQWWGDMITCNNWHEIWLNEGFASYAEALYYEVKNGTSAYHNYIYDMANSTYGGKGYGPIYVYDTVNVNNIFNSRVYDKAACVLHMLRHIVGDNTFFDILHTYYNSSYQHSDVTTEQFKNLCEAVAGIDLDYFFDQWIYGNLRPSYVFSYYFEKDQSDGQYWTFVNLTQVQTSEPQIFTMPIDVVVNYTVFDADTFTVFNDAREQIFILKTAQQPVNASLDPLEWVLKYSGTADFFGLIPFSLESAEQLVYYEDTIIARGGDGTITYEIVAGDLPNGMNVKANTGVISGIPDEFGDFSFTVRASDALGSNEDYADYSLSVTEYLGFPGDVNFDHAIDILDIVYLIESLYKDGEPLPKPVLADVNNDCLLNILDIVYLINYKYKDGPAPIPGCVK